MDLIIAYALIAACYVGIVWCFYAAGFIVVKFCCPQHWGG